MDKEIFGDTGFCTLHIDWAMNGEKLGTRILRWDDWAIWGISYDDLEHEQYVT